MKTSTIITFGENALAIAFDATWSVTVGSNQPFADLTNLDNNLSNINPYATYEPDFWLLNGKYKFVPTSGANVGYMSVAQTDNTSDFTVPQVITASFTVVHSTQGITLRFSNSGVDFPSSFAVAFYNSVGTLIRSDMYYPQATEFSTNQAVSNFKSMKITLYNSSRPQRYARLMGIDFDIVTRFSGSAIKASELVEQIDPTMLTLPINTFEATLYSIEGAFDLLDPAGLYATIQYKNPLDVHLVRGDEVMYGGRFYIDTWENISNYEFKFTAMDIIGVMDTIDHDGGWFEMEDPYLALDIFAELFTPLDIAYTVNPFWNTYAIRGWLRRGTYRSALQQLVMALTTGVTTSSTKCVVNCSRSSGVYIDAMQIASADMNIDHTLTPADRGIDSFPSMKPLVTAVKFNATEIFSAASAAEIWNGSLPAGQTKIYFDEAHQTYTITGTGATIVEQDINYIIVNMTAGGVATISAKLITRRAIPYVTYAAGLPANTKPNIVEVDAELIGYNGGISTSAILMKYFDMRYVEKAKVFASAITPGSLVLCTFASGRELKGRVERMVTDCSGGLIAELEIVGVII